MKEGTSGLIGLYIVFLLVGYSFAGVSSIFSSPKDQIN